MSSHPFFQPRSLNVPSLTTPDSPPANSEALLPPPPHINPTNTLRIILQNPNGINPHISANTNITAHSRIRALNVGVLCLPETNVNWSVHNHRLDNNSMLDRLHRPSKTAYSSQQPTLQPNSYYLPGGTCTTALGPFVSKVISTLVDTSKMGRWSGLILRGRDAKPTAIVTCYRVPETTIHSSGSLTSFRRQAASIAGSAPNSDTPNPRKQCLDDLTTAVLALIHSNHDVILCMDANEALDTASMQSFLYATTLSPVEFPQLASTKRGSKTIDHVLATPRVHHHIMSKGPMNFDSVYESDHRPLFLDLDPLYFLTSSIRIEKPTQRILRTSDLSVLNGYLDNIQDATLPILQKLHQLEAEFANTPQCDHDPLITRYNKIDDEVGLLLSLAEHNSGKSHNNTNYDWSPALKQIAKDLAHLRKQIRVHRDLPSAASWKRLHKEKVIELKQYRLNCTQKRIDFLHSLSSQGNNTKQINIILRNEKRLREFRQVKQVLSKPHQPLTRVIHNN
jgi:hypothetical protein